MRRIVRFASTVLASLSLALIVLATISGGEAKAIGIFTCGSVVADPNTGNLGCSSSCWIPVFPVAFCDGGGLLPMTGNTCYCQIVPSY